MNNSCSVLHQLIEFDGDECPLCKANEKIQALEFDNGSLKGEIIYLEEELKKGDKNG